MLQNIAIIILGVSILYLIYRNHQLSKRIDKSFKSIGITDSVLVDKIFKINILEARIEILEDIQDEIIDCLYEEEEKDIKKTKKK